MELQEISTTSNQQPLFKEDQGYYSDLIQSYSIMEFHGEFDECFTLTAIYYRRSQVKCILYIFLLIITGGLLFLFQRWFLKLKLVLLYTPCKFQELTHVLMVKTKNSIKISDNVICTVNPQQLQMPKSDKARVFQYELSQFYIDSRTFDLHYLKNSFDDYTCEQLSEMQGLNEPNNMYGPNIMDVPIKPIPLLLLDEILTPFNIFQFAALALWAYDSYLAYSMFILVLTLIQIGFALKDLRESLLKIRNMILFQTEVQVIRRGVKVNISSSSLTPGDVFLVKNHSKLPCDAILIKGQCIMNEAILTGESIPINKTSLIKTKNLFTNKGNENSILFNGTSCLRSTNENGELAEALVYQTGFQTLKGGLARSIMFSKTQTFSFQRDSMKYLIVLACLGAIFAGLTIWVGYDQGITVEEAIINALEIMTIIIPPTLPTALGAGISLAINRLESQEIQCIKPDKVNVAAKVNILGFDKTGTLTELGLEVLGCRPIKNHGFDKQMAISEVSDQFLKCMATCHSLTFLDNELQGDPIDLNMFQNTGWSYREDGAQRGQNILRILRRFEFVAELQRMSVIVDDGMVYAKGSPEMISHICVDVPANFQTVLQRYTSKGYRVLGCAFKEYNKELDINYGSRDLFESEMQFLGFLIFENKIKPETTPTITQLKQANLKPIMVTGDNPYTAINIGLECGILDRGNRIFLGQMKQNIIEWTEIEDKAADLNIERSCYSLDHLHTDTLATNDLLKLTVAYQLVITGDTFTELAKQFASGQVIQILSLLKHIYVYSRMKPNHKGDLMTLLKQDRANFLAFCGDGTNDTCALRSADIGLALSTEDASLAAPFTSTIFNISSMVTLIREGRASLVTSVECFKFMTLYSCIQSAIVLQCYFLGTDLSTNQYLYQDLWLIIPLAFTMDLTKAFPALARYRPISNLISLPVILSVIGSVLICAGTQVAGIQILYTQDFYEEVDEYDEDAPNQINSLLIMIGNTQVLATAIAFTQGPPFRQKVYENIYYMIAVIVGVAGHVCTVLFPHFELFNYLALEIAYPWGFRWEMVAYNCGFALFIIAFEKLVIDKLSQKYSENEENQGV